MSAARDAQLSELGLDGNERCMLIADERRRMVVRARAHMSRQELSDAMGMSRSRIAILEFSAARKQESAARPFASFDPSEYGLTRRQAAAMLTALGTLRAVPTRDIIVIGTTSSKQP